MSHQSCRKSRFNVRSIALLLLSLTAISVPGVGCNDARTLDKFEGLKTKMCACKDVECVSALEGSWKGMEEDIKKLTGEDGEKALALARDMKDCAAKAGL